jgi:hypothetical protein
MNKRDKLFWEYKERMRKTEEEKRKKEEDNNN